MNFPFSHNGIYAYPIVEYIPLYPHTLARKQLAASARAEDAPGILVAASQTEWEEIANRYQLFASPAASVNFQTDIAAVLLHCTPLECKYRDRRVTIIVLPSPGTLHAFSLPKHLFYRSNLEFILYSPDGTRLAKSRQYL